jgi:hypothetical protein
MQISNFINKVDGINKWFESTFKDVSTTAVSWVSIVLLHSAFIPTILSVSAGVADRMPTVDIVLFVWVGLLLNYIQSIIQKNILNVVTHGVGFFIQAVLLALVLFK